MAGVHRGGGRREGWRMWMEGWPMEEARRLEEAERVEGAARRWPVEVCRSGMDAQGWRMDAAVENRGGGEVGDVKGNAAVRERGDAKGACSSGG